ncbi:MAG: arsenate reductase (glutaredoxin) [Pseudomonadales bacterium]|jgi:arsenate reductase
MPDITLYHNPNCSKSRGAKEILESSGADFEVVEYLKTPLSATQIGALLDKLGVEPAELVRKDSHFKELGLDPAHYTTAESVADLLAEHPRLMQRPVVVRGGRAVIARPSELVEELL